MNVTPKFTHLQPLKWHRSHFPSANQPLLDKKRLSKIPPIENFLYFGLLNHQVDTLRIILSHNLGIYDHNYGNFYTIMAKHYKKRSNLGTNLLFRTPIEAQRVSHQIFLFGIYFNSSKYTIFVTKLLLSDPTEAI